MSQLFLTVLNMSFTASYVILFVIIIRLLLKKAPKIISYVLWSVVAFRLITPFSFESMFSLIPRNMNIVPISHDIIYQQSPQINSGIEVVNSFVNNSLPTPTIEASVNPLQIYMEIGAYIWAFGIIALLVNSIVSVSLLKRQLKSAQLIEKNIFEAKYLKTPFVLGLINPKIYLPVGLSNEEQNYILIHEQTHIYRKDYIIKTLAFLIVSIHWFNPLVWIAFILMSTDMELSCDERVLKEMNEDIKKPYANSLLSLATGRHILSGSPLAFGEGDVKGRIINILNYKKPRFWVIAVSIIIVTAVGTGLILNPKVNGLKKSEQITDSVQQEENSNLSQMPIEPVSPILSLEQDLGVGMPILDYASDDIVIFHSYFGLFVYDLNKQQIIRSIDLIPLNCHLIQGSNYCDVFVSLDGNTVYLHPMESKNMYIYTVSSHTLQETAYKPTTDLFKNQFVPIEEATDSASLGNYSYHAVKFGIGEYGYLYSSDWTLSTLYYVRGDTEYRLFDFAVQDKNNYFWEKPSDNKIIPFPGYLKNVSCKMQHETAARSLSVSKDTFSKLFSLLSGAVEVSYPKSFLDGYQLILEYESTDGQSVSIWLYGFHDGQTICTDIRNENGDVMENSTGCFQSAELVAFIQSLIGWREFDIQNLSDTKEINVQIVSGIQKSDNVTVISGKDAEFISKSMIQNSIRQGAGECGYNIKVVFKNEDGKEYYGLLAGDSCPDIAIEGCVFRIDPAIVKMIYKKINYDMPIGNS